MEDIPRNIALLTGPVLFGNLFSWGLFGILTVQVYLYYLSSPRDKPMIKSVIYTTYTIEIIQTTLATREASRILGSGWGNVDALERVGLLGVIIPILVSILTWISQTFYAWRIWVLRKSIWIPLVVASLALTQLICGVTSGIRIQIIGVLSRVEARTSTSTTVRLVSAVVCDVIIATSMSQFLYSSKNRLTRMQNVASKLIRVVIETGLILVIVAIIDLTFFLTFPQNNLFYAPAMSLSKLYSNSMLVMSNARIEIVGGRSKEVSKNTANSDLELAEVTFSPGLVKVSDSTTSQPTSS
ncbi:hypothetical protein BXZ70DRAFT_1007091 [Cristinia sonorae]|uniref:DUF6534 domain-containing protein n=1 Tax=Cristinia sonorae TaxID=1940300 RepID=A0A8K0XR59_9AGAR|nr:hypothetical protein BXZ70DRAFT_1007091 [Cristinia sonorae]